MNAHGMKGRLGCFHVWEAVDVRCCETLKLAALGGPQLRVGPPLPLAVLRCQQSAPSDSAAPLVCGGRARTIHASHDTVVLSFFAASADSLQTNSPLCSAGWTQCSMQRPLPSAVAHSLAVHSIHLLPSPGGERGQAESQGEGEEGEEESSREGEKGRSPLATEGAHWLHAHWSGHTRRTLRCRGYHVQSRDTHTHVCHFHPSVFMARYRSRMHVEDVRSVRLPISS